MQTVVALGEVAVVGGYGLAGALVHAAETEDEVRHAWTHLPPDVGVVILSARAARTLDALARGPAGPLTVVLPS